jgi:uncharacterized protein GlcG (DUF336 family)
MGSANTGIRTALRLDQASAIVDAALAAGRRHGFQPLTVAVLDAGGHLVALKREDGSGILRVEVAVGKAYGALGLGVSGRALRDIAVDRPFFTSAVAVAAGGRFVPVSGGVLIRDAGGGIIGAVGISGDTSDNDERAAIDGVRAAGLEPDPAEPAGA